MFKELLSLLRTDNPLKIITDSFVRMLDLARQNTLDAGTILFDRKGTPEERGRIYEQDIEINKLERSIRKRLAIHLTFPGNASDVPHCLLIMSLVKDVERLGDYAKNVSEILDLCPQPLPEDDIYKELQAIRREVERSFEAASQVFSTNDRERALQFIHAGRDVAHRCNALLARIAASDYNAATTTAVALGTRYYKRIGGHVLNVLSSLVMPLHKIDYYDEDAVPQGDRDELDRD